MCTQNKNYHKIIISNLTGKHSIGNLDHKSMLRHFVVLMGEENFNQKVNLHFRGGYPDSFDVKDCKEFDEDFHSFHKSMRQTDFFNLGLSDGRSGNIDMLWWNFIQFTDITEKHMRYMFDEDF